MKKYFLLLSFCFFAASIQSQDIEFQLLKYGNQGSSLKPKELVIASLSEAEEKLGCISKEELLTVDFEKNVLLVVFQGRCNSGGHKIFIENIACKNNEITVQVMHQRPGRKCYTTKALTTPYAVYKVAKNNKEWKFRITKQTVDCD